MNTDKVELLELLEQRYWATSNDWKARKRRLEGIPMSTVVAALQKARKGEPLTREEYMAANLGFTP